ncbi:MAG: hypothetical protein E7345_03410 [Clostridiales bacterium]|nr:hypothetical protein [Clostridiales bacterium]
MGFFNSLKNWSNNNKRRKQEKEARKQAVNHNPTDEQLKDNKKGKRAYLWTIISIVVYLLGFGLVASAWEENIALGIMALLMALMITPITHKKAISLAQEQRRINGKGLIALMVASILPLIVLAGGFFFFVFGGMYIFR